MTTLDLRGSFKDRPFLLVGERPNVATVDVPSLWLRPDASGRPHSANRLLRFAGWSAAQYLATFDRTNLVYAAHFPFGRAAAGLPAGRVASIAGRYRGVVLLGVRVARAFWWYDQVTGRRVGIDRVGNFAWSRARVRMDLHRDPWPAADESFRAAIVPHPSGMSRVWNDPQVRARAREFFSGDEWGHDDADDQCS